MQDKVKILLVDDHTIVRAGLKSLLENLYKGEVICESSNGREALEFLKNNKTDIVMLDINMPELNGLDTARIIKKEYPEINIIILSMYSNEEYIKEALKVGASGYLLKDSALNEIEVAIESVLRGNIYLSPSISRKVVDEYLFTGSPKMTGTNENIFYDLTPRQREILQLIVEGNSTKEIAFRLKLSVKTVEAHRHNIMQRLSVYDIPGLVKYAIRNNLISDN